MARLFAGLSKLTTRALNLTATFLPHAIPLPLGEGAASCDFRQLSCAQTNPVLPAILPLPAGEGRGEGERVHSHKAHTNSP